MGDEQEAVAVVDALSGSMQTVGVLKSGPLESNRVAVALFSLFPLDRHPAVHRRGRCFDVEESLLREIVQPVEDLLVLLGRNHPRYLRPSGGHQEEHRPLYRPDFFDKRHHVGQQIQVVLRYRRVHLGAQADCLGVPQDAHGPLP